MDSQSRLSEPLKLSPSPYQSRHCPTSGQGNSGNFSKPDTDEEEVIPNSQKDDLNQTDPIQDEPNLPSTTHIQKRERKSEDRLGGITGFTESSKNEKRFPSKRIRGSKPHPLQPANQASHNPDHKYRTLEGEKLKYLRKVTRFCKERVAECEANSNNQTQKEVRLEKEIIEMKERHIKLEEKNGQLEWIILGLQKEILKLKERNLENEKILNSEETRKMMVILSNLERNLNDHVAP